MKEHRILFSLTMQVELRSIQMVQVPLATGGIVILTLPIRAISCIATPTATVSRRCRQTHLQPAADNRHPTAEEQEKQKATPHRVAKPRQRRTPLDRRHRSHTPHPIQHERTATHHPTRGIHHQPLRTRQRHLHPCRHNTDGNTHGEGDKEISNR